MHFPLLLLFFFFYKNSFNIRLIYAQAKSKWITDYGQIQLNDGLLDTDETEQSILGLVSSTLALQLPANLEFFPGRVLSLRCVAVLGAREWKAQRWTILHQGITRYPGFYKNSIK